MKMQQKWSKAFDRRFMPEFFRTSGNGDYIAVVVPQHLRPGMAVCDIGGGKRPLIARAALHAEALALSHPVTGEPLAITAPWPKDLTVGVKYLRRYALA